MVKGLATVLTSRDWEEVMVHWCWCCLGWGVKARHVMLYWMEETSSMWAVR